MVMQASWFCSLKGQQRDPAAAARRENVAAVAPDVAGVASATQELLLAHRIPPSRWAWHVRCQPGCCGAAVHRQLQRPALLLRQPEQQPQRWWRQPSRPQGPHVPWTPATPLRTHPAVVAAVAGIAGVAAAPLMAATHTPASRPHRYHQSPQHLATLLHAAGKGSGPLEAGRMILSAPPRRALAAAHPPRRLHL